MTDTFIETPAEPTNDRHQLIAAILLGIAAILTAFAAYQGDKAGGAALQGYSQSTRTLSDANAFYAEANQTYVLDQQLFVSYATAAHAGQDDLAAYLLTLMRPELQKAVEWWQETDEAETPFDEMKGNPYTLEPQESAEELEETAGAEFDKGAEADDRGDKYQLATVMLALTLFFCGVATLFHRRTVTIGLLAVGGVVMLGGAGILLTA